MRDSRLFFHFRIDSDVVQDLPDGEYTYNLIDDSCDERIIATGLLQIGDYKPENNVYDLTEDTKGNTYIQYNS